MMHVLDEFNLNIPDPDYKVILSGIGLHVGVDDIYIDKEDGKVYGHSMNLCFEMGENEGEEREVMVTDVFYETVKHHEKMKGITWVEDHSDECGGFDFKRLKGDFGCQPLYPGFDKILISEDSPCKLFWERQKVYLENGDLTEIDAQINGLMRRHQETVVMYKVDWDDLIVVGMHEFLTKKKIFLEVCAEHFAKFGGEKRTDMIFCFGDSANAVKACIDVRKTLGDSFGDIPFEAFGLHVGELLVINGTELLLGDCINTASKLGEDLGKDKFINVSDTVFEIVKDKEILSEHPPTFKDIDHSNVEFKFYQY